MITLQEEWTKQRLDELFADIGVTDAIEDIIENDPNAANTDVEQAAEDLADALEPFDIEPDEVYDANGDIEKALENALRVARREKRNNGKEWNDICLVGEAGVGKTSRFWTWSHQHPEINVLFHDAKTMDELDFKGKYINKDDKNDVKYSAVRSDEFDMLEDPNQEWVLFLDEFNRAKSNIRGSLLTLVCDHQISDPSKKNKVKKLPGLLFTVVASNPVNGNYNIDTGYDTAEKSRWEKIAVTQTPQQFKNYILPAIEKRLKVERDEEEREAWAFRYQLADKLLSDPRFKFDTSEEINANMDSEDGITVPRSLKRAIYSSYDLDEFYKKFGRMCNPLKLNTIKSILSNFEVVDDKANQLLNTFDSRTRNVFDRD